ncbi:MAG: caspase family protein [Deltaproteobacteria bacterium]|nr:caspase family protein [Deltaproteobacteria bacterium]
MKIKYTFILTIILFLQVLSVNAATMRYALIIGNNEGIDSDGRQPFSNLQKAESEAEKLRDNIVNLSNFSKDSRRTILLTDTNREAVNGAIRQLIEQKKKDEAVLGSFESVFLFYFTGHGLQGKLLLTDGPLFARDVDTFFKQMNASFSVGIFDACHSGSLSPKGIKPTVGLNMIKEMPKEVLNAKGRIWYVSSSANQISYEDKDIGGVFTHFFIEGLTKGRMEGPGITLDNIWNYARNKTVEYTANQNIRQIPEEHISNLKTSSPVFFSFPLKRKSTLILSEKIGGRLVLSYADGQLTEIIDKKPGHKKRVAVYPGQVTITKVSDNKTYKMDSFVIGEDDTFVLKTGEDKMINIGLGVRSRTLFAKGDSVKAVSNNKTVVMEKQSKGLSLLTGVSYEFAITENSILYPRHSIGVPLQFDYGMFTGAVNINYNFDKHNYPAWGYSLNGIGADLRSGVGLNAGKARLSICGEFKFKNNWQQFNDGPARVKQSYGAGVFGGVHIMTRSFFSGQLFVSALATYGQAVTINDNYILGMTVTVGLNLFLRIL